jgi:hypothetical protein
MFATSKGLIRVLIVAAVFLLGGIWAVQLFVRMPASRTSRAMIRDLRRMSRASYMMEETLYVAQELTQIDGSDSQKSIEFLRSRAIRSGSRLEEMAQRLADVGESVVPLAEYSRLLLEVRDLLDAALEGAPSDALTEEELAGAPVEETDPDRIGVAPGVKDLVEQRSVQVRKESERLTQNAEERVLGGHLYVAQFAGLSARRWLVALGTLAAVIAAFVCLRALSLMRTTPEQAVEDEIEALSRQNPQQGMDRCYARIEQLLALAGRLMRSAER